MESVSELRPLLRELKAKRQEIMSGDRNSGCRSSAALGGSSGGRSSSGGKGGSGSKHPKGSGVKKAGWEDAGVEFYREAYPGALENLYDNSLRTLLPSKRYSIGTLGRTTVRRRASMRNRRRQQSSAATTLVHTTRRGSDTYLEVMPDLTQGVDEEETWEELQQIRLHAVSMQEKRYLKQQLLSAPTLRTRGFAAVQFSRRKFTSQVKARLKEMISKIGIWHGSLKYVEGNFGTGLVAFFTFIKWLLFLNLFSSILIITFIVVPQIIYTHPEDYCGINTTNFEIDSGRMAPLTSSISPPSISHPPNNLHFRPTKLPTTSNVANVALPTIEATAPVISTRINQLGHPKIPFIKVFDDPHVFSRDRNDESFITTDLNLQATDNNPPINSVMNPTNIINYDVPSPPNNVPFQPEFITIPSEDDSSSYDHVPSNPDYNPYLPDYNPFLPESNPSPSENEPHMHSADISSFHDYDIGFINEFEQDDASLNNGLHEERPSAIEPSMSVIVPIILEGNFSDTPSFGALLAYENITDKCCFQQYKEHVDNKQINSKLPLLIQLLMDSIQGTGKIEISYLFYGFYPRANFTIPEIYNLPYRLSLTYLCVMISIFLLCLILMIRKAARGLKDNLRSSEGQFYQFSNLVFGGWDHCIENNTAATIKKKAIYNELKNFIETERYKDERAQRTRKERCRLYFKRLLINALVILILGCAFFAIYTATSFSFKSLEHFKGTSYWKIANGDNNDDEIVWWQTLLFEFLPSGTIVTLNIVVPQIFKILIRMEKYTPNFILTLTLMRMIFLRLASLVVLLFTVYTQIRNCEQTEDQCVRNEDGCNDQIRCWETYVGQQMYKLTLLDLVIIAINTFIINLPRKIIGDKILRGSRIGETIGSIEFEIPKHVLDIVYGQTLCWLGMFYSPLLPVITCIKLVLVYYMKYFDCAVNTTQSSQLYRTSRSNSLFISILLLSFIVTIIPVGFSIAELKPSISCGPFYNLPTIWHEIIYLIQDSPQWLQKFLFFLGTAGFAVPTIILLILAAYYYYAVAGANKHMVSLLKHQLVLEGHDKQFLLTRLDKMIKRTQELEDIHPSEMSSDFNAGEYSTSANNDLTLEIRGGGS